MSFYLDTSVIIPLHVEESKSDQIVTWLRGVVDRKYVADLAVMEFNAATARLMRMGKFDVDRLIEIHTEFEDWRSATTSSLENSPVDIRLAAKFVRNPSLKLLAADAIHLATCHRAGLTLVTDDIDLLAAAKRLHVAAFSPP